MLAGTSGLNIGTRVKIVRSIFKGAIGKTGHLTAPYGNVSHAIAGVEIDKDVDNSFRRTINIFDRSEIQVLPSEKGFGTFQ